MRRLIILVLFFFLSGCATTTPYKELNLDTTSGFKAPTKGMAGIYVYQIKKGIFGSAFDVNFEIKGEKKIALNTGEYGYFEIKPGRYEYKLKGGLFPIYIPVDFDANENYFFRASLLNASDVSVLIRDQLEIDDVKSKMMKNYYEPHDVD